ncbi:MAG: alpha/beta hydrolase [Clostridia bacterium]|nr:alpha/beta hydrolase [Clostridia bacterium]
MVNYDKKADMQPDIKTVYRTESGINLPLWVYNPRVVNDKNNYFVLAIHGGGWRGAREDNSEWNGGWMIHQAKIFSLLGYTGAAISYRTLGFDNTDIKDLIEDCREAVKYIRKNFEFEKLIIIGDSAGGHLATCLGIDEDDCVRPDIVLSCNPVLDCTERFSYASEDEEVRIEASPLFSDIKKCADFLFMHGNADPTVPYEDTVRMHEKLQKLGFNSEMITLDGIQHAFILYDYKSTDEQVVSYMEMIEEYLNKKL